MADSDDNVDVGNGVNSNIDDQIQSAINGAIASAAQNQGSSAASASDNPASILADSGYQSERAEVATPAGIYKLSGGVANGTTQFMGLTVPAWNGCPLTFETWGSQQYHVFRNGDTYFYVVRHGKYDSKTDLGLSQNTLGPTVDDPPTIGSTDSQSGPGGKNVPDPKDGQGNPIPNAGATTVNIPDPHLTKTDFVNIVYPRYDNAVAKPMLLDDNNSSSTEELLHETVDNPEFTPNEYQEQLQKLNKNQQQPQKPSNWDKVVGRDKQPVNPNYHVFLPVNLLALKTHPDMAAAGIIGESGGKYGQQQAYDLVVTYVQNGGSISPQQYYSILGKDSPYSFRTDVALSEATGKSMYPSTPLTKLKSLSQFQTNFSSYMMRRQYKYECRLFNFYADNDKFYSGSITCTGRLGFEYGKRLIVFDTRRRYAWEFYIDGVAHHIDWKNGWTTTVQVERGLPFTFHEAMTLYKDPNTEIPWLRDTGGPDTIGTPIKGDFHKRFEMFWGHAQPFVGGFFGEQTLNSMISQANERDKAYMSHFNGGGGSSSGSTKASTSSGGLSDIIAYCKSQLGKHPYSEGQGTSSGSRNGMGFHTDGDADCSSFCYFVLKHCGYKVPPFDGNAWSTENTMDGYCKSLGSSGKNTQAGDIAETPNHMVILAEKYRGDSTHIYEEGGYDPKTHKGDNVNYSTLGLAESIHHYDFYEPEKK